MHPRSRRWLITIYCSSPPTAGCWWCARISRIGSYVFTRFEDSSAARVTVMRSDGVLRILGNGATVTPIPDDEIAALRIMLDKSAARCMAHPLLREGAWVRMKRGPLKDLEGLLV